MAETDKPRISDADMLARFQGSKKRPPCSDTLGMTLVEVEQDAMRIRMDFDVPQMFANPTGAVQGGFISAMLDEAMSTCVIIASNVTMTAPTLEMKTSFLRRLMPGAASVDARILKLGRSAAFMEAECFGPEGELVAKATATAIPMPFKRLG
ncbi:MAG: PaaI family thioesterase [Alphaproteobacteria bacterium]|uniref:PaaI family thioesterase n=1 Tax=Hyphomonas sp. TaxID=87 RepID=UPI001D92931E|nr:PaaI family thioesterase [Alphaproteobacteria bacterium]MBU2084425.1 PaaI family thioesterase [Alphaproteobacteria bacterium]MBU2142433.1 PaaI family thioesterase [Alphaproteobacteria bacterium]MBU2196838.1 PaaI family thioesterase [Alphaproteobacteria bacterium]